MSPVPATQVLLLAFRGDSEVTRGQPQRPAGLGALRGLEWAPVLALGTFLPPAEAENPRSSTSELSRAQCIRKN